MQLALNIDTGVIVIFNTFSRNDQNAEKLDSGELVWQTWKYVAGEQWTDFSSKHSSNGTQDRLD